MKSVCLPHTELPGTSALFADYLYHFDRVARFYAHSPHDPDALRRAAAAAQTIPDARRAAVVDALRRTNPDSASLASLELPDTVVIVTGQQVGLFSGPAYTVYKALTAARLARELTESGIRAVPVFWLATEDHDFAEVDHCHVFGSAHEPLTLKATSAGRPGQPVGSLPLTDVPLAELRAALQGFLYADEAMALVEEAYQPGRTYGHAFRALLERMLAGYGLVFLDPLDPHLREVAAPFLREALDRSVELGPAIRRRNAELAEAGYHAQVLFEEQNSLFFWIDDEGRRLPLRVREGKYFDGTRPMDASLMSEQAARLSPNALLRPVLQDWLLPTAAYVGGPAELAYLAQSQVLYDALLGRMPVAVSRSGFTLLDPRAVSLLHKYDLHVPDTFHGADAVRNRIAERLIPPQLEASFARTRSTLLASLDALLAETRSFDPTLGAALEKSRAKMLYQLDKNRGKVAREALNREQLVAHGAAHLSGLLYPERHLQERYYSFLPFLAKHGPELLDTIYDHVHRPCPDHLLLEI